LHKNKVIVIGAGVAGMSTAARLAAKGYSVTIIERNEYAGGKLGLLKKDDFTFDTGPSLFTQPYVLEQLFADCGERLDTYLQYTRLAVNTHYFYEDGTALNAYHDHALLLNELETKLHIDTAAVTSFLQDAANAYQHIGGIFLDEPIHELHTWLSPRIPKALSTLKWQYLFQSMHKYHKHQLKHPKLVQLFDRFATYNGSNPYSAPAMLSMIAHLEMNEGAYYPNGGMRSISNALVELNTKLGVDFIFNAKVDSIVADNKNMKGVIIGDKLLKADCVVSNSDIYYTYKTLLNDAGMAGRLQKQERSSSAIIFYWGIARQFEQLGLHNIFFSEDYKTEFDCIFKKKTVHHDPTVYINITSKMDANHAPQKCENWFVLVNTPTSNFVDSDTIYAVRRATLDKLSRMLGIAVEELLMTEEVLTPADIDARTGSYLGALYGTASNNPFAAFMRHSNVSKKYKGLFLAGGTVHPGGGIPLCLRSGKLAADAVMAYHS
jgi:phytoene desaturase